MAFLSLFSKPPSTLGRQPAAVGRDNRGVYEEVGVKRKRDIKEDENRQRGHEKGARSAQNSAKMTNTDPEDRRAKRTRQKSSHGEMTGRTENGRGFSFLEELNRYQQAKAEAPPIQGKSRAGQHWARDGQRGGDMNGQQRGRESLHRADTQQRGQHTAGKNRKKNKNKPKSNDNRPDKSSDHHDNSCKKKTEPDVVQRQPFMTPEFISQHAVEHRGRYICKYFLGGRCIKEDQCKFEHEMVVLDKKAELCKFYVQDSCTKGENCIYMHKEYPCKFFHTGTNCFCGDQCKFSHDPLTETTRVLLEKVLNKNEEAVEEKSQAVSTALAPTSEHIFRPSLYNSSCVTEALVQKAPISSCTAADPAESAFPLGPSSEHPFCSSSSSVHDEEAQCASQGCAVRIGVAHYPPAQLPAPPGTVAEAQALRDVPAVIPLEPILNMVLRDPRQPGQARAHINLSCPAFAQELQQVAQESAQSCVAPVITSAPHDMDVTSEVPRVSTQTVAPPHQAALSVTPITLVVPSEVGVLQGVTQSPAVHSLPVQVLTQWGRQGTQQTQGRRWIQSQIEPRTQMQRAEPRTQDHAQNESMIHTEPSTQTQNRRAEPRTQDHAKIESMIHTELSAQSQTRRAEPRAQSHTPPSSRSLFRDMFKTPLPQLSSTENSVWQDKLST